VIKEYYQVDNTIEQLIESLKEEYSDDLTKLYLTVVKAIYVWSSGDIKLYQKLYKLT